MRCVGFLAASHPSTRTRLALTTLLDAAAGHGADTELIDLAPPFDAALAALEGATALVFASPVYRAAPSWTLKAFLEAVPRGRNPADNPLRGRVCATISVGGSDHHFLASDGTRAILGGFFAAQVLSPALALSPAAFDADGALTLDAGELVRSHGAALVEFARAVAGSPAVRALAPLA